MNEYDMEISSHQQYDHEAKQREEKWSFRADDSDHVDTEALMEKAEATRDAMREDGTIARFEIEQEMMGEFAKFTPEQEAIEQVEQERNLNHAQDNQI